MNDKLLQVEESGLRVEYNHDLDVSESFLTVFPSIRDALKDTQLLKKFYYFDEKAIAHKKSFHSLGLWSLILGASSLIATAILIIVQNPAFPGLHVMFLITHLLAIAAIVLVVINRRKRHRLLWCQAVFWRERLRQWHFQKFLDGTLIEKLAKDKAEYEKELNRRWALLEQKISNSDGEMAAFIKFPAKEKNFFHEAKAYSDPEIAKDVFEAIKVLRFEHQLQFSQRKIQVESVEDGLAIPERETISETIASSALAGAIFISGFALILSGIHELTHLLPWDYMTINRYLSSAALLLAVISAASRAYNAGFTLPDESESYEEFCDRIREIEVVFQRVPGDREKLAQFKELEDEAAVELRRFLRMKKRATFLF